MIVRYLRSYTLPIVQDLILRYFGKEKRRSKGERDTLKKIRASPWQRAVRAANFSSVQRRALSFVVRKRCINFLTIHAISKPANSILSADAPLTIIDAWISWTRLLFLFFLHCFAFSCWSSRSKTGKENWGATCDGGASRIPRSDCRRWSHKDHSNH